MSLTTRIREYRLRDRMSQEELAQRVGVRRETIGNLENGKYNPSLKLAMDIAHVFGCTVEDLFTFTEERAPERTRPLRGPLYHSVRQLIFYRFPCRRAARSVFSISMARVTGPTPPGTGVIYEALGATWS